MARGSPGRTLPYRHRLPSAYGQNKLLTSPVLQRFPKDDDDEAGDTDRAPFLPSPSPSRRARYRPSPSGSGSRSGALDAPTNFLIASLTSKRCQPFLVLLAFSALTTLAGVVSLLEHRSGLSALGPSPLSAPDLVREPPLPEELHHPPATHTFVRPPRNQQRTLPPIQAHAPLLKADCLEQWIAQGTLCDGLGFAPENGGTGTRIDGVWSWVNGSDPRHRAARRLYGAKPHGWWDGTPPLPIAPHTPEAASARATLGRRAQTTTQNTENRFR